MFFFCIQRIQTRNGSAVPHSSLSLGLVFRKDKLAGNGNTLSEKELQGGLAYVDDMCFSAVSLEDMMRITEAIIFEVKMLDLIFQIKTVEILKLNNHFKRE